MTPRGRSRKDGSRLDPADRGQPHHGPSVRAMIAAVAVVVALTILIFFALGYLFGRAYL